MDEKCFSAYYNRAEAWLRLKKWDKAKADLTTAKKLGMDIVVAFHDNYKNVEKCEQLIGAKLPSDIASFYVIISALMGNPYLGEKQ